MCIGRKIFLLITLCDPLHGNHSVLLCVLPRKFYACKKQNRNNPSNTTTKVQKYTRPSPHINGWLVLKSAVIQWYLLILIWTSSMYIFSTKKKYKNNTTKQGNVNTDWKFYYMKELMFIFLRGNMELEAVYRPLCPWFLKSKALALVSQSSPESQKACSRVNN